MAREMRMQTTAIAEQALIVESRVSSRKEIAAELLNAGLVSTVLEAPSVGDGLGLLSLHELNACFLGPSLTKEVATNFLIEGKKLVKDKKCAFVAILNPGTDYAKALTDAGADGAIHRPFNSRSFTRLVTDAIKKARLRNERATETARKQAFHLTLPDLLEETATGLKTVAEKITAGSLKLDKDGQPSLATRDAIRLSIENAFSPLGEPTESGTFNHHFVTCLVEWFVKRINTSEKAATEQLRQRLLGFYDQERPLPSSMAKH